MGWVVSSDKTTGSLGTAYSDAVKNANEVKFVGTGLATVSGQTVGDVRTITVDVNAQNVTNNSIKPVEYTKADGTKVYPVTDSKGNTTFHTTPNGAGDNDTIVPNGDVITSINGADGTKKPTTLSNVKSNLPETQNNTAANGQPSNATKSQTAPTNVNANNAATAGDVLNAGWNLQGNGTAVDFVKPYDTVNFANGANTTVVTDTDGTTSTIKVNVTGLPITYTDADGNKVAKADDGKWYPVDEKGSPDKTKTEVPANNVKTNLVNAAPTTGKTDTTSPTQLGNVTSGLTNYTDTTLSLIHI